MELQPVIARQCADGGQVFRGQHAAAGRVVGILEADKARAREMLIVRPDRRLDLAKVQRAGRKVGQGPGVDPAERGHAALLVQKGVRALPDDRLLAASAVGENRNQVAHGAAEH